MGDIPQDAARVLLEAAKTYMATNRVFRSKPMGAPNSEARRRQTDQIEAEDILLAAIAKAEGRAP